MKHLVCCLCLLALTTFSAHARLGETAEQLESRFGPGTITPKFWGDMPGVTYRFFWKQNFNIYVGLLNGKSAYECYRTDSGVNDKLIMQLLEIQSEGHAWSTPQKWPGTSSGRVRDDGAVAFAWQSAFVFESKDYADLVSDREKASAEARKPRVDGF